MDPKKPFKKFGDAMHVSTTFSQIPDVINSAKLTIKSPENKYNHYHGFNSVDSFQSQATKSLSPKKLPPISHKTNEISNFEPKDEKIKNEKFVIKTIKKPENLGNDIKGETLNYETLSNTRKSMFFSKTSQCPFSKQDFHKGNFKDTTTIKGAPNVIKQKVMEVETLGKLWGLFSSEVFGHVMSDFEEKVKKVPQLAKYFQNHDIGKVFQGKWDFFKRNIGKSDINMHNRYLLETIHKKMNISNDDFDVFKGFFAISMRDRMIEEGLIADFLIFLEHFRKDIVSELSVLQKAYSEIPEFENALIQRFMEKIQKNQIVSQYFANKDHNFTVEHCKAVIDFILNSRKGDFDSNLRTFHKNCEISDHVFYFFKQCLLKSLREFQKDPFVKKSAPLVISKNLVREPFFTQNELFEIGDLLEETRLPVMNRKSYYEILTKTFKFEEIVAYFLQMVSKKPSIHELFLKFTHEKVRRHAEIMLTYVLGGPTKYSKSDITPAHFNLEVSMNEFGETRQALEETLLNFKVSKNDSVYILAVFDSFQYNLCNEKNLLIRMGGTKTIDYTVNRFYLKAHQHPQLCEYFNNTDVRSMTANQKFWFAKFFENTNIKPYHFRDLRTLHMGMGITKEAFSYFAQALVEGLKEFGHKDELVIREALEWLGKCQNDVLNLNDE